MSVNRVKMSYAIVFYALLMCGHFFVETLYFMLTKSTCSISRSNYKVYV